MDDNQQNSPWDDLLKDLGAEPDQSAYERHQPEAQEIPPAAESSEVADEPSQSSSDWNSLASSLGIEVEEPTPTEPPAETIADEVIDDPVAETPPVEEQTVEDQTVDEPVASEDAPAEGFGGFLSDEDSLGEAAQDEASQDEAVAAGEEHEINDDNFGNVKSSENDELPPLPTPLDQALSDTAWHDDQDEQEHDAANASSDASSDEQGGAGITGEAARSAFDALFADGATGWGSAFLDRPKPVDEQGALIKPVDNKGFGDRNSDEEDSKSSEGQSAEKPEGEEETDRPKRKRSRRRRRGGKGRKPAGERPVSDENTNENSADQASGDESEPGEGDSVAPKKKARRSRSRRGPRTEEVKDNRLRDEDDDDFDDDLTSDGDEGDGELAESSPRGPSRGRKRHANLPTWSDAISMIVDANLEQRAKSPSKPQSSRSRGGRGGGGRRRSSKKPDSK